MGGGLRVARINSWQWREYLYHHRMILMMANEHEDATRTEDEDKIRHQTTDTAATDAHVENHTEAKNDATPNPDMSG